MANTKSFIREIDLQNTSINLNKNKSIVSDFTGFNKNTGVWYNNALSNLYYKEDLAASNVFTVGEDIYKVIDGALYKNDVLIKDFNDVNKVSSNILPELNENTIAYAEGVNVHIVGDNVYANDTLICEYDVNAIPYLVSDKEHNTWCIIYNDHFLAKGKPASVSLYDNFTAFGDIITTAIYCAAKDTWCVPFAVTRRYAAFKDPYNANVPGAAGLVVDIDFDFELNSLEGSFTLKNWQPEFKLSQIDSRTVFANIVNYKFSENTYVYPNDGVYKFKYLKGLIITDTRAEPFYSQEGDDINFTTKIPNGYTYDTQNTDQVLPLRSIKTKYLSYYSMLTTAYATVCHKQDVNYGNNNFDGIATFVWESLYTKDKAEFMTMTGNTSTLAVNVDQLTNKCYPRVFGILNDLTPEWLYTNVGKFKLIYNKDALVNISIDNSIICPWNDVDENSLTIDGDDIYYYSLNSNAWVHINVSKDNDIKGIVVGNKLILNTVVDNCYDDKDNAFTYSVDSSAANITVGKPRMGFMNILYLSYSNYYNRADKTILRSWLERLYEKQLEDQHKMYFSIGRDVQFLTDKVGPIWAATTATFYDIINYRSRDNTNRFISIPEYNGLASMRAIATKEIDLDKNWFFNNVSPSITDNLDIYVADTPTVLEYYSTWVNKLLRYNQKLQDTEKAFNEPSYYNLSPNIDIMSVIDGFNTIILVKTGNSTQQILFKNGEALLIYNILSGVSNISDYFVLQGQQYGIINGYINRIEMVNGQVVSQLPITSVEGLKFLGNTDKQAFFFSQMNKTLLYFAADNTLEFLSDATELDGNITTVFAKQTNDIFMLLNDKVVVLTNNGSMFELDNRAEYIVFGDKYWSDGNKVWSYYKIDNEQKRYPISLETLWYGDTVNRKMMNVDTIYIETYDDNYTTGKLEISMDSLMNNTASTKKQIFNIKEKDYDKVTKTVYLRFQPAFQNCTAFKLNINSEVPIKRLAVGYSTEGIPLISKNNI